MVFIRSSQRKSNELRPVSCELGYIKNAEGSCLIKIGNTHVICTASIEERVPHFLKRTGTGWVTAEYSMLPAATETRTQREAVKGKLSGRTQEIQRLIGRSLRATMDLAALGERQIHIDCDVINADGGTRCAAITGGYIALHHAVNNLYKKGIVSKFPIISQIASISCGIVEGNILLDLEYTEDSQADVDANFVLDSKQRIIEIQSTAEKNPFTDSELNDMLALAKSGVEQLNQIQNHVLGIS